MGLLDEIKLVHRTPIEARRIAMLDGLEREGRTDDMRALIETVVLPFTAEMATESGRDYLRILPQVTGRLGLPVGQLPDAFGPRGIRRTLHAAVEQFRLATEWNPTLTGANYNLGLAYYKREQYKEAMPASSRKSKMIRRIYRPGIFWVCAISPPRHM